jgi:DNA-binding winged helix-turn-helix (wHTH) protein
MIVHRFGPFELDPASRALFREHQRVRLPSPQAAILAHLVTHAGVVISKETLIDAGWEGVAVSDNSLDQAISRLRKLLGDGRKHATYIETIPQQGYRFTARVERSTRDGIDAPLETQLAPFRAVMQARTELETLDRDRIGHARQTFEEAVREAPDYLAAHVGLAMACGLLFKASTPDAQPDAAALEQGIQQGRDACAMAPQSGKAWSALGFLLYLNGDTEQAAAAASRAVTLEPDLWRHAILAAYVTWGDDRLHAARRALALCPGLALAHWLRATVFIARGAFEAALEELRAGCAAQDAQKKGSEFPAVGLHLLHGLVLAARGRLDEAATELRRELPSADSGLLYARECAANTWYAIGAVALRQQKRTEANEAFKRALTIAPHHVSATAVLYGKPPASVDGPAKAGHYLEGPPEGGHYESPAKAGHYERRMESALGQAIVLARGNRNAEAARVYGDAIARAPRGSVGWLLPVEPLLHPLGHREIWDEALTMIRVRAS